jgi:hypothetical protein
MQRTSGFLLLPLPVELLGQPVRIGIELDDAVEGWPLPIELLDPAEVMLHNVSRTEAPRRHFCLQTGNRGLLERKRLPARRESAPGLEPLCDGTELNLTFERGSTPQCYLSYKSTTVESSVLPAHRPRGITP